MRRGRALVAAAALAALGSCAGGSPGPEDLEIDFTVGAEVALTDGGLEPEQVTVAAGELVVYRNRSDGPQALAAADDRFDAGELLPGDRFTYDTARDEPGPIEVECSCDPDGVGTITVTPHPG